MGMTILLPRVTSVELSQQLHTFGLGGRVDLSLVYWVWRHHSQGLLLEQWELESILAVNIGDNFIYAYTIDDLLHLLGDRFLSLTQREPRVWLALSATGHSGEGDTSLEAVAQLVMSVFKDAG
jgi:hypothetical protein